MGTHRVINVLAKHGVNICEALTCTKSVGELLVCGLRGDSESHVPEDFLHNLLFPVGLVLQIIHLVAKEVQRGGTRLNKKGQEARVIPDKRVNVVPLGFKRNPARLLHVQQEDLIAVPIFSLYAPPLLAFRPESVFPLLLKVEDVVLVGSQLVHHLKAGELGLGLVGGISLNEFSGPSPGSIGLYT